MSNKQATTEPRTLGLLIERLGPLNNQWRDGEPKTKVVTLWDMGEVLLSLVPDASDTLLWDLQARSYITRNVLRYALIVRRSWERRSELEALVSGLQNYTVFLNALPFLKGDHQGIDSATYRRVVSLLPRSDSGVVVKELKGLKAQKIGRHHQKGESVEAVKEQATKFRHGWLYLEQEALGAAGVWNLAPADALVSLSQLAMAVATGESIAEIPATLEREEAALPELAKPLIDAARQGRSATAAFRRLVGQECLMQSADLLNSLRDAETFAQWRRRNKAPLPAKRPTG